MAISRALLVALALYFLLTLVHASHPSMMMNIKEVETFSHAPAPAPAAQTIDCGAECGRRCGKTKRPNLCKRACGSCCSKCHCVPQGTAGNLEACPCYASLTTKNGIHKCP